MKVLISTLILDPANARKHDKKNLEAIKGSLARFGQQKPIIIGSDNVVIAGNGTLEAARALGWTEINIVRSDLKGSDRTAYAIVDNRTAELAKWDNDILAKTLAALQDIEFDLNEIGFDEQDIRSLDALAFEFKPPNDDAEDSQNDFKLIVTCKNEDEQQSLFIELRDRGLKVK